MTTAGSRRRLMLLPLPNRPILDLRSASVRRACASATDTFSGPVAGMAPMREAMQHDQGHGATRERPGGRPDHLVLPISQARPASSGDDAVRRYRGIAMGMAFSDAACVVVALVVSYLIRYDSRPMAPLETAAILAVPLLWVAVFHTFSLYSPQHLSAPEEFRRVIGATSVGIVLLVLVSYWSNSSFSRGWIGLTWLLTLLAELATRQAWHWQMWRLRRRGVLAYRTLVVGTTAEADRLCEILSQKGSGFVPLGYVRPPGQVVAANTLPVLGELGRLRELIREHAADCLFVASAAVGVEETALVAQAGRLERTEVRVSVTLPQVLTSRLSLQKVGPAIALSLRPVRLSVTQAVLKRAFDLVAATTVLLASLPVCVAAAIAIRLTSQGPVFFHQERVTKGGHVFRMHKFRTMRPADRAIHLDTTVPFFKLESDPRLTRVGKLIRRLSIDELPQLWNVIKGDMSIVGPRPLPVDQVAANAELLSPRHEVPAGLTGWWQINGRSGVTAEEALRLDLFYVENWSLSLDLYILMKTFGAVVGGRGAY
jgi:exopolysaccharide biosynthesis polyprenyl glycosylphosphotransferase